MISMLVGVVVSSTEPSSEDIDIASRFHETVQTLSFQINGSMPEEHSEKWYGSSTTTSPRNIDVDHVIEAGQRGDLNKNNAADINTMKDTNNASKMVPSAASEPSAGTEPSTATEPSAVNTESPTNSPSQSK